MKHGNVSDKANLPEATCYNQPRQQRHHRQRPLADGRRTWQRGARAIADGAQQQRATRVVRAADPPAGGDGLPDVCGNLTAAAIARGEAIEREVREEMSEEVSEHRRLTNAGRPDGHGSQIFIGPRYPTRLPSELPQFPT